MSQQDSHASHDEVDRIIAGWHRALPALDTRPMAVASRLWRIARHLDNARRSAFAAAELEAWEFDMLSALRRSPSGTLSPGALGEQTMVTSGTVSTRLDKLAARGLVRRERNPDDGRGVRVRLEAEGETRVDQAITALVDAEARLLTPLGDGDREQLAGLLRLLLLGFEHPDEV